jgi:DNA modification methylase
MKDGDVQPYVEDRDFLLLNCDVLDGLRTLPDESVHCVVTSPPYWGLRDYGTGLWDGGDPDCDHVAGSTHLNVGFNERWGRPTGELQQEQSQERLYRNVCGKCGARRQDQQLGLEADPETYVARMVEVFREVRRVLRSDGTIWCNLGDSYAAGGGFAPDAPSNIARAEGDRSGAFHGERRDTSMARVTGGRKAPTGLKPKDLVGIPWQLAFALQQDGWYLRSEITWCKPNAMPESVTDRPTKATEKVFLLTRSPRYYYDPEAIRTEHQRDGRAITQVVGRDGSLQHRDGERWPGTGANARDWWLIATEAFADAHFATFPQELVRRCILAGTSERGCCPECGTPWERETTESTGGVRGAAEWSRGLTDRMALGHRKPSGQKAWDSYRPPETLGWRPMCNCEKTGPAEGSARGKVDSAHMQSVQTAEVGGASTIPCTVLDPFLGSGTTAFVARKHGRRSIGIELNPDYCALAARRMQQQSLLFT